MRSLYAVFSAYDNVSVESDSPNTLLHDSLWVRIPHAVLDTLTQDEQIDLIKSMSGLYRHIWIVDNFMKIHEIYYRNSYGDPENMKDLEMMYLYGVSGHIVGIEPRYKAIRDVRLTARIIYQNESKIRILDNAILFDGNLYAQKIGVDHV